MARKGITSLRNRGNEMAVIGKKPQHDARHDARFEVSISPGFTGGSEGWEYYDKLKKLVPKKALVTKDGSWIGTISYFAGEHGVKSIVNAAIKAGKNFWHDEHTSQTYDLNVFVEDKSKEIYPTGEFEYVQVKKSEDDEFILITIHDCVGKHTHVPRPAQKHNVHERTPAQPAHKKKPERITAIDMSAFSSGQFKWGYK